MNKNSQDWLFQTLLGFLKPGTRFSKVRKGFRSRIVIAKPQTLRLQIRAVLYRGSLHTRNFRRIHISVFRYRLIKNDLKFPGLSRNGPLERSKNISTGITSRMSILGIGETFCRRLIPIVMRCQCTEGGR